MTELGPEARPPTSARQAAPLEEVGPLPTRPQTADQAEGRGTLSAQPGQHLLQGAPAVCGCKRSHAPPAGTSGQSFQVGSESSSEETEAPREAQLQKWQSGDSAQVWVRLDLQAVIPLPSSDLPHPGVLPHLLSITWLSLRFPAPLCL